MSNGGEAASAAGSGLALKWPGEEGREGRMGGLNSSVAVEG